MSTWILLRGLTREARHWGGLPDVLRDTLAARDVYALDLPGNGTFARLRSPLEVADMVGFVRLALLQAGKTGPFNVLAMSLGGMVAADWATRHPADIARLVLVNTSMRPFNRAAERLQPGAWPDLAHIALAWGDPQNANAIEARVHRLTCNRRQTFDEDVAAWSAIRRSAPVTRANALRQLWAAAHFSARATAPACPVLVLSSRGDELVNPVCSQTLAARWQATHLQHPWAGHDLPHDDPLWTCQSVDHWMAESAHAGS
ncbi:alpha/beta fold hydrolase [Paraburkholderia kururiensis]|uniref:alpha/beta fold hydrolase n=1 Tax=Paraburkholderia kururiensis TaxID=984307 RepID=UPI000F87EA5D|nr:alpha/beta hydrolase [Paraburkholderia kururiensis]